MRMMFMMMNYSDDSRDDAVMIMVMMMRVYFLKFEDWKPRTNFFTSFEVSK